MSNDYALFIIFLSNDFNKEISSNSVLTQTISTRSIDTGPTPVVPSSLPRHSVPSFPSMPEKDIGEHLKYTSTESLCVALRNYFSTKGHIEAVWMLSENKKTYQITFYIEFGLVSDRVLQDLVKLGIGRKHDTKIFVLPTAIILEGHTNERNGSISTLSLTEGISTHDLLTNTNSIQTDPTLNDLSVSQKIRKHTVESNFKKSVRARLMVHQVVASIRASTELSFDFVVLICLASMLAAFGLLENSSVIIVASMLVSPLMNPILGVVFGLSVREHSLWRRGLRNELIGLIICISCGFILGLFTTFTETKWGNSSSFPTSEMKARGDIKRLWVGVLIALPSGAGVALSVLGGNTGSLVGVAISASLLPPAVNCGLLFAYSLLGASVSSIAATYSSSTNDTYHSNHLNCTKYINNDYQPLYECNLVTEAAILAGSSLLLTIVNILCIIIMALFILRIKEVVPLHQPNEDITNFFHYDVKVARDYNKTIGGDDSESNHLTASPLNRNNLAQSLAKRWKTFKSINSHESQQSGESVSSNNNNNNTESRRKLLHLKTFAKEYNLDVFNKCDYDLLNAESREKVRLLINDLIDMFQEVPQTFIGLFHLQPSATQALTNNQRILFYEEIVELLPPKWYQLFVREQQRRQIMSSPFHRTYSLRTPRYPRYRKYISESNEDDVYSSLRKKHPDNKTTHCHRQNTVPITRLRSISVPEQIETETSIEGTRFRVVRPTTLTTETLKTDLDIV